MLFHVYVGAFHYVWYDDSWGLQKLRPYDNLYMALPTNNVHCSLNSCQQLSTATVASTSVSKWTAYRCPKASNSIPEAFFGSLDYLGHPNHSLLHINMMGVSLLIVLKHFYLCPSFSDPLSEPAPSAFVIVHRLTGSFPIPRCEHKPIFFFYFTLKSKKSNKFLEGQIQQ